MFGLVVLAAGAMVVLWLGLRPGVAELRFENAKSGPLPHTIGKAASASYGPYRWENVQGWVPYTVEVKDTAFIAFVHDPKPSERPEHVLVAVNTNTGIILESAPFHGLLMGPGMQGTTTSAWQNQGKIHYEETTYGRIFHFEAMMVKTNVLK